jgi:hypothetical protein
MGGSVVPRCTRIVSDVESGGKYETVNVTVPPTKTSESGGGDCRSTVFGGWKELVSRVTVARSRNPFSTPRASGSDMPTRSGAGIGVSSTGGAAVIRAEIGGGSGDGDGIAVSIGRRTSEESGTYGCGAGGTIFVGRTKTKITT